MPEILFLDFETACALDLKKSGASRYSRDPSLIVTVVGWAFDDDPAQAETVLTLGPRRLPPVVEDHIRGGGLVSGWNSRNFEANILRNYFGLAIPHAQITDTMQAALHGGLPAALGDAGPALGLPIVKDATAHRLMLQMARPRAIRPDGSYRWWHEDDAEKLERLRLYCAQDVEAERAISKAIPQLPERELRVALLDARANAKGVRVDVPAVRQLIAIADASTKRLNAECVRLTNGQVSSPGSQTARLLAWLGPFAPPDLTKDSVASALARDDLPPHIRRVLEIRQLAAKSSVKKLQAVLSCVDEDDAIRGILAYYGASRTGRWAGRLFQPQNLPRPSLEDPDLALDLVADGADVDLLEALFGPPLEVVSSCLRGILIPRPGHVFIVFDLSQIEARMVAWLAGQDDILRVFARGDDVYIFTANKLGLPSRQAGKVCVLGLGFGLGKNRFVDFAATYGLIYSAAEAEKIVRDWRAANPMITAFWRACDKAVRGVLEQPTNPFTVKINGKVSATVTEARDGSRLLTLLLPSGRRLYYRNAMLSERDDSSEVVYAGVDQKTRKWGLQRAFGPKTVENLTQAAARDVIVHMALEIERKRLGDVILSVHDELIVEVPLSDAEARYEAIKKIMNTAPDWAKGLPVKAEGHILKRYGK